MDVIFVFIFKYQFKFHLKEYFITSLLSAKNSKFGQSWSSTARTTSAPIKRAHRVTADIMAKATKRLKKVMKKKRREYTIALAIHSF